MTINILKLTMVTIAEYANCVEGYLFMIFLKTMIGMSIIYSFHVKH